EWGRRKLRLSRELWIEREDFSESPPKGYFRLFPGNRVRLRYGYIVECIGYDKTTDTVRCTYDPDTRSGTPGAERRKVKGNIHWLAASSAQLAEVRLYDRLFIVPQPGRAMQSNDAVASSGGPARAAGTASDTIFEDDVPFE